MVPVRDGGFLEYERPDGERLNWNLVDRAGGVPLQGLSRDAYGDRVVAAVAADGALLLYIKPLTGIPRRWEGPYQFGRDVTPRAVGNMFKGAGPAPS